MPAERLPDGRVAMSLDEYTRLVPGTMPVDAQPPPAGAPQGPPVPPWERPAASVPPAGPSADPPLTEAYIAHVSRHDLPTFMRRHDEIRAFMRRRARARTPGRRR